MNAVRSPHTHADTVRALLAKGADPQLRCCDNGGLPRSVIRLALTVGDPDKAQALVDGGVDLRYRADCNYDALIDAVRSHSASIVRLERKRPSLEEVFLSMVGSAHNESNPNAK